MNKKVLVVEDHPDMREFLKFQLEKLGYKEIDVVGDFQVFSFLEGGGVAALILAAWERSSNMSITLGEGVMEMAKAKNIPVILMTTNPKPEHLDYLNSIGADFVLVKPFFFRDLDNAIKAVSVLSDPSIH